MNTAHAAESPGMPAAKERTSQAMDGTVIIVQESRLQLTDDDGVSHLFILGSGAAAEPAQLQALQRRQARVRVRYRAASNVIGNIVSSISPLD
jgi:hypothetical protein